MPQESRCLLQKSFLVYHSTPRDQAKHPMEYDAAYGIMSTLTAAAGVPVHSAVGALAQQLACISTTRATSTAAGTSAAAAGTAAAADKIKKHSSSNDTSLWCKAAAVNWRTRTMHVITQGRKGLTKLHLLIFQGAHEGGGQAGLLLPMLATCQWPARRTAAAVSSTAATAVHRLHVDGQ
jgi:hypothetical protein